MSNILKGFLSKRALSVQDISQLQAGIHVFLKTHSFKEKKTYFLVPKYIPAESEYSEVIDNRLLNAVSTL